MFTPRSGSVGAQLGFLGGAPVPSGHERFGRPLFVRVSFEVRTETTFGDTVVIVGETPQLGGWVPERGIRMSTCEENYPIWRVEPLLLNEHSHGDVEFKFVVLGADGHQQWEPLPHNRRLLLGGEEVQVISGCASFARPPHYSIYAGSVYHGPGSNTRPLGAAAGRPCGMRVDQG